jgi:glycosyltransferase involved in cell wall biosynthesis
MTTSGREDGSNAFARTATYTSMQISKATLRECGKIGTMATVGVIIPAYNAAKTLAIALESVASQTFDDWQILLVDDGSTDNTAQVVAPFLERFGPKIKFIQQENRGLPAARNTAIRSSTTEFLALLDADDVWLPCRLEESVKILRERPRAGLAYGGITCIDQHGHPTGTFQGNSQCSEGRIAPQIYMRRVDLPCPTLTFRRSCIQQVGLFDETMRATEDRDLCLRIALRYEVAFVPRVIAFYRISPSSMTTDPQRMFQAQMQFIKKNYGAPGCGWMARRASLSHCYRQRADALSARHQPWAALASALRAVAFNPFDIGAARAAGSLLLRCTGLYR